jgi:hypothetical protein
MTIESKHNMSTAVSTIAQNILSSTLKLKNETGKVVCLDL